MIYLIGSLRSPRVPQVAKLLRESGYEVFDDWYAAGPEADDYWQKYEQARGHTVRQAMEGYAANNTYNFDKTHLDRADAGVLVMPAGKSGHLELGYLVGRGKPGFILLENEPERWDVMYRFAEGVSTTTEELIEDLSRFKLRKSGEDQGSPPRFGVNGAYDYFDVAGRGGSAVLRTKPEPGTGLRPQGSWRD